MIFLPMKDMGYAMSEWALASISVAIFSCRTSWNEGEMGCRTFSPFSYGIVVHVCMASWFLLGRQLMGRQMRWLKGVVISYICHLWGIFPLYRCAVCWVFFVYVWLYGLYRLLASVCFLNDFIFGFWLPKEISSF